MPFLQEFKKFMSRGSVLDMAVGIILGASFTKIVDALVNHVLMPPLGVLVGGIDFSRFKLSLQNPTDRSTEITMDLGLFLNACVQFFILSFAVFVLIKVLNQLHAKSTIFTKKSCPECKLEIPIDAVRCGYCTSVLKK